MATGEDVNVLPDYYEILYVRADAPIEIIRSSYRTLMQSMRLHPDLGGLHEEAQLINEAYAVLSDPDRRADYDARRRGPSAGPSGAPAAEDAGDDTDIGTEDDDEAGRQRRRAYGMRSEPACPFCATRFARPRLEDPEAVCAVCSVPLSPAVRHRLQPSGRRMLSRFLKQGSLTLGRGWPTTRRSQAVMVDLSLNGMRFIAPHPLEPDETIRIHSDLCHAVARVAHCERYPDERWAIGVEFITLKFASARGTFVSSKV